MKKIFLALILIVSFGCSHKAEKPDILSFQNRWGVAYYIYPRYQADGCSYRAVFLPLKNPADAKMLTDSSSIFDFQYGPGVSFYSENPTFLDQIKSSNSQKYIRGKGDSAHIVYWAFMKLKYHIRTNFGKPVVGDLSSDTLTLKQRQLPVRFFKLDRYIDVDTAYGKKKYINPWSDPKLRLKMRKNAMPCFYAPFHKTSKLGHYV